MKINPSSQIDRTLTGKKGIYRFYEWTRVKVNFTDM